MTTEDHNPVDPQRYDMATVKELIGRASLRELEAGDTVSRQELEAIAAECGIAPDSIAQEIDRLGHTHSPISAGWFALAAERQGAAILAGGIVGVGSATLAGGLGLLLSPSISAFVGSVAMLWVVALEGAFARCIRGTTKHATFQALNLATWGGWSTASVLFGQPELSSVAIAASAASAVMGSALIAVRSRDAGDTTRGPMQGSDRELRPAPTKEIDRSSSRGADARISVRVELGRT